MRIVTGAILALLLPALAASADMDVPPEVSPALQPVSTPERAYFWRGTPVGNSAQLLTLFCKSCALNGEDLPVVSVLRDTLGVAGQKYDRLTDVWLLSDSPLTLGQRLLAGVPFFYWRAGKGDTSSVKKDVKPILNVSSNGNQLVSGVSRQIVQWTILDPMTTMVRASSRAYASNAVDEERLHLEEAISYLSSAPAGPGSSQLTQSQVDVVIARLESRKHLLGGLMTEEGAAHAGESDELKQVTIRGRNWDLLRQCAEKTGLVFTPLDLEGEPNEYALLWFPQGATAPRSGSDLKPIWKLLNVRDPRKDPRVAQWKGPIEERQADAQGNLLPVGVTGVQSVRLIPIGAYSLDYPRQPLLLVDFMGSAHVRRHEMTQRSINEITSGVIGISHFTNWYYYVAADLYDFVASRHGVAMEQDARLDCYSRFRAALALDHTLDSALKSSMQSQLDALSLNPLESAPQREMQAADIHYEALQREVADGKLSARVDKERRQELATFGASRKALASRELLHDITLGAYTARVPKSDDTLSLLRRERLIRSDLTYLQAVVAEGPKPEVTHDVSQIQSRIRELADALAGKTPASLQLQAQTVVSRLQHLTEDPDIDQQCLAALRAMRSNQLGFVAAVRPEIGK